MPDTMDITSFPTISTSHSNTDNHSTQSDQFPHGQKIGGGDEEKTNHSISPTTSEPIRTTPSTIWTEKNRGVIGVNVSTTSSVLLS